MMKLLYILQEAKYDEMKQAMKQYFIDCSKKYFSEYHGKYPLPKFVVRQNISMAGWYRDYDNEIGCIPELHLNGDDNLKSTVYHETIHYYQAQIFKRGSREREEKNGHGQYFIDKMKEINSGEGKELVTVRHDAARLNKSVNVIYVYVLFVNNKDYAYVWTPKLDEQLKHWIETAARQKYTDAFIIQTNDYYFKTPQQKYNKSGRMKFGGVEDKDKIEYLKQMQTKNKAAGN